MGSWGALKSTNPSPIRCLFLVDDGVTKLLFDDSPEAHGHGKILGGGMVGTHAGDMIGEIALAIEMGADAVDIGKTIMCTSMSASSMGCLKKWRAA